VEEVRETELASVNASLKKAHIEELDPNKGMQQRLLEIRTRRRTLEAE